MAPEPRKRFFVDPALYTGHWLMIGCMKSTENDLGRIPRIGRSIHLTFRSFGKTTERRWTSLGCSALLPAPRRTRQQLANPNRVTCCRNAFIGSFRSQKLSVIRHSFWAHGAAAPLVTRPAVQPSISGKLSRPSLEAYFPTLYSQSPIGPRKEDFSDLSGMFSLGRSKLSRNEKGNAPAILTL